MDTAALLAGLTPTQRTYVESLSPVKRQEFLDRMAAAMGAMAEPERIEVPEPPQIDEQELVATALFGDYTDTTMDVPDALHKEFVAQLGGPHIDPHLEPSGYRRPVQMLNAYQAATLMGVSRSTVHRLRRARLLPAFQIGRTVRIRSDDAWAMRNRLAAGRRAGDRTGWTLRTLRRGQGAVDKGVPIAEVADTLQVHPHTLWRWWRRFAATAAPRTPARDLLWRCAGSRAGALIPEDLLVSWGIPYDTSSLRLIRFTQLHRLTTRQRRLIEEDQRRNVVYARPADIRRNDQAIDAISGTAYYTVEQAAARLQLSTSGARKALARAGITALTMGGRSRYRHDDVEALIERRTRATRVKTSPALAAVAPSDEHLVPIATAAKRMGTTVRTLRRRAAAARLELVTADGRLWVRRRVVDSTVKGAKVGAELRAMAEFGPPRPDRGAALSAAHVESFTEWVSWRYPHIDPATTLFTRSLAATTAKCRPSVIEALVVEGLIPARRQGRDLCIRTVDLQAAAVFSAKVARMCPGLRVADAAERRAYASEFLTFDQAAKIVKRPATEVRYLVEIGTLHAVRFGRGAHRLHESEVFGPGLKRFREQARPYRELKYRKVPGWGLTVNAAANMLDVCERTVLRWIDKGAIAAIPATKRKYRRVNGAYRKVDVPVNRGGFLVSARSVRTAQRLRQVRGVQPRDVVAVTAEELRSGRATPLQPWERYQLVNNSGAPIDEYGQLLSV